MTIQHLVPLLERYGETAAGGEAQSRHLLAEVILQGISPDPELFATRLDLLGPYSMIQHLFVSTDEDGQAALTAMGRRHVNLVERYIELIRQLAPLLHEDLPSFRPMPGHYSPYGVMYGFSSNILEHMTLKAMQPGAEIRFSLEDVFNGEPCTEAKLAWVSGWRQLPHVPAEVLKLYEYPQQFAEAIYNRMEPVLRKHAASSGRNSAQTGKLHLDSGAAGVTSLPAQYVRTADPKILSDRQEGMHLVSYETTTGWVAVSKDVLTSVIGEGISTRIDSLPEDAAQSIRLMYSGLIADQS
jgi:hypothetical protein